MPLVRLPRSESACSRSNASIECARIEDATRTQAPPAAVPSDRELRAQSLAAGTQRHHAARRGLSARSAWKRVKRGTDRIGIETAPCLRHVATPARTVLQHARQEVFADAFAGILAPRGRPRPWHGLRGRSRRLDDQALPDGGKATPRGSNLGGARTPCWPRGYRRIRRRRTPVTHRSKRTRAPLLRSHQV